MSDVPASQLLPRQRGAPLDELPLLIPIPLAAKLLGISRSAAYRCAASGDLPITHLGGRVYVVTARLQSLLESE
jgi:Helix-turn-helix domain